MVGFRLQYYSKWFNIMIKYSKNWNKIIDSNNLGNNLHKDK